ncbi:MAG: sugar transferase [Acidimicrobiales bacterium]|nr:sugar transferase [Acidimicrobiales bacterium]
MTKRAVDVVGAVIGLVLLWPVMVIVAIAIRVTMGRPVLFRQERAGRSGAPFELLKFRTMREGAGTDAERLTRVGRLLRSTSLDELPQLWNVLRGDMSLVGPRPLYVRYIPLYSDRQRRRLEVRPGITGLAQIEGRNSLDWPQRLELDVRYVESRGLLLDLRIMWRTVAAVVHRDGISGAGTVTMTPFTGTRPTDRSDE